MLEERLLVWQFNRGRTEALREIYERYKLDLVTLATALLADKAEAEDVVHDVFVGFLKSSGKFRLTGSLKGFLATCVANRARNWNKVSRRRVVEGGESFEAIAPDRERPDWATVFEEELQHVARAMAELPYEQREAVLLHLRGGLTFCEIADMQGVSINTVQGRHRYGLEKLRSLLNRKTNTCNEPMTSAS
ncbi:MAG: RNA polymerase sigma factor [Verrucomicrobia bacterium]|nr:RNA polymerase sigma factor [Verrucomicrobiota bacterium]